MLLRGAYLLLALGGVAPPHQDDVVIRTTTSLVEVRVVAETSHHKPVADLAQSDFRILDNGQPQAIRLFAAYRGPAVVTKSGAAPQPTDSTPTPSDYALILLDWLNCTYASRIMVKEQALQLLKDYQPRQRLAIYVLSRNNPRLLADFTYDRDPLAILLERLPLDPEDMDGPAHAGPLGRGGRGGVSGMAVLAHEEALFKATNQLIDTTHTFDNIAARLLHLPGRKALLWVTLGIPMTLDGLYYAPFIEPALARLNKSDVAIYAVYANGFTPNPPDSILEFARRTGGVAYYDSNDLTKSMRQALEDTNVSSTLGFHMPEDAKPGAHEILVEVNRPKIKLRYRESYDPSAARR